MNMHTKFKKLKENILYKNFLLGRVFISIFASLAVTVVLSKYIFTRNSPKVDYSFFSKSSRRVKQIGHNFASGVKNIFKKRVVLTRVFTVHTFFPRRGSTPPSSSSSNNNYVSIQPPSRFPTSPHQQPTSSPMITTYPSFRPTVTQPQTYPTSYQTPTSTPLTTQSTSPPIPTNTSTPTPTTQPTQAPITCPQSSGRNYNSISVLSNPTDRPAESHPDLNIKIRGFKENNERLELVDYSGPVDPNEVPPKFTTLVAGSAFPRITHTYQVYDWNWSTNTRGDLLTSPYPVTLIGLETNAYTEIRVPRSGYDIGQGYQVMVLYADNDSITLKYTREDNVVTGYTVHILHFCVDANLLSLYNRLNSEGRHYLPALKGKEVVGVANSNMVQVTIRDTGSFMDPRSRKDWW